MKTKNTLTTKQEKWLQENAKEFFYSEGQLHWETCLQVMINDPLKARILSAIASL